MLKHSSQVSIWLQDTSLSLYNAQWLQVSANPALLHNEPA